MKCPWCDEETSGWHSCPNKPMYVKVSWMTLRKAYDWLKSKFKGEKLNQ